MALGGRDRGEAATAVPAIGAGRRPRPILTFETGRVGPTARTGARAGREGSFSGGARVDGRRGAPLPSWGMTIIHSALALALVLAAPDPATEAPPVEPEDAALPEGPAEESLGPPAQLGPAPAPAEPSKGLGLIIAGAAAGGVGLLANVGRIAIINSTCANAPQNPEGQVSCGVNRLGGYVLFTALAPLSNVAGAVLLGIGGAKRGTWEAHQMAHAGRQERSGVGALAAGAALLGTGVVGYVAVRGYAFADLNGVVTCFDDASCLVRRWSIYLAGIEATQAMAVAGSGLLGYGIGVRKGRMSYPRVSAAPVLAPTYAGFGVQGRF